jgi:hypothetical protein
MFLVIISLTCGYWILSYRTLHKRKISKLKVFMIFVSKLFNDISPKRTYLLDHMALNLVWRTNDY